MAKISVMTPVYFNEESIAPLFLELTKVEQALAEKGHTFEIIFVDDGSGDNSLRELLKIKQQREATRIIKLTRNFGAMNASKIGYQFVTGDCVVGLAADLQDPPELIPKMVEKWTAGAKFVLCARTHRNDPLTTRWFSTFYYWLLRLLVVKDYPKRGFDLCLMDKAMLAHIQNSGKHINLPLLEYWLGFKPEIIYYERRQRPHGKSRFSFAKRLKVSFDSILGFSIVPIRLISLVGFVISLLSFAYGSLVIVTTLLGRAEVPGFATVVALVSFLLGLVIVMLGIISEYLWRIYDETNHRPGAVIDEIY
jgi:glycosyltransferase involved in cell wall biosynthesis